MLLVNYCHLTAAEVVGRIIVMRHGFTCEKGRSRMSAFGAATYIEFFFSISCQKDKRSCYLSSLCGSFSAFVFGGRKLGACMTSLSDNLVLDHRQGRKRQ